MPLGTAQSTGGGFYDFKDLVDRSGGPVFIFAKVKEFKAAETGTKRSERGAILPVVADIFIATGPDAGQLKPEEEIIGAPTAALRGVNNPSAKNGWAISEPVNKVGVPYAFIVSIGENAGNAYVKFDLPKGAHQVTAEQLYEKFGDDELWNGVPAEVPAQRGEDKEPVGAGAGAGGAKKKPWA